MEGPAPPTAFGRRRCVTQSERKDIRRYEKQAKLRETNRINFIVAAMSTPQAECGFDFLSACHIFADPFTGDALVEAYSKGERNVGLKVYNDIVSNCPNYFIDMMKEANIAEQVNDRLDGAGEPTNPTPTNPPLANDPAARTETGEIIDRSATPLPMNLPQSPNPKPLPQTPHRFFLSPKDILSMQPPSNLQPLVPRTWAHAGSGPEAGRLLFPQVGKINAENEGYMETLRTQWREELKADKDIGGKLDQVKVEIGRAIDRLPPTVREPFKEAMNLTGAGDHPAVIKAIHAFASLIGEGTHVSGGGPRPMARAGRSCFSSECSAVHVSQPPEPLSPLRTNTDGQISGPEPNLRNWKMATIGNLAHHLRRLGEADGRQLQGREHHRDSFRRTKSSMICL